ncbi:secreted glycosyl hydrolase [Cystobacter fuscus]|uniref:Secreted glycosyl hydrolase n=2 Tax=Cystobacter fuscus TaxID=43 RepID=A0A250JGC6_9BACT|nr:secreted glycosyl hydrolase [Cystobacter fuscus]
MPSIGVARGISIVSRMNRWGRTGLALTLGMSLGCAGMDEAGSYEGELRMFAVDNADGSHQMGYGLVAGDGTTLELKFDGEPTAKPGDRLIVRGERVGRSGHVGEQFSVHSFDVVTPASEGLSTSRDALAGGTAKTARVAILPLVFPGTTARIDTATSRQRLDTVAAYYKEISYGSWTVQGDALAPLNMPKPTSCALDVINSSARAAAKSQGINLDVYAHVAFVIPNNPGFSDCACGLAWIGNPPTSSSPGIGPGSLYTCTDPNAFAHEMGHGFGMNHSPTARCGTGVAYRRDPFASCSPDEYGNRFNTMGGGLGHLDAFHKSTMGWLNKCNIVRASRDATYDLVPIQTSSTGIQALEISTGGDKDGSNPLYYWVEYRNPTLATFNAGPDGAPEVNTGVHINVAQDFRSSSALYSRPLLLDLAPNYPNTHRDPRLTSGRTFSDPDGRVSITVVSQSSTKATVKVSFPNGGTGTNTCADGTLPGGGTPPGPQDGSIVRLVAKHSGKCLDVPNSSTTSGTALQQYTCNGTNAQAFRLQSAIGGFNLVNVNSGKCVDVSNSSTADGATIQQWDCNNTSAQTFSLNALSSGGYTVVNANSARCADVDASSLNDGAKVRQWSCNGGTNQQWTLQ